MEKSIKNMYFPITILWNYRYDLCLCYPTSHLYLLQVWNIQTLIMESSKDEDEVSKDIVERTMMKFNKYEWI